VTGEGEGAVLYVRQGCHLCDQFLLELTLDLGPRLEGLTVLDVDTDAGLAAAYGLRVPVLAVAGQVVCEGLYEPARARRALRV
jgi:hypothetical protein